MPLCISCRGEYWSPAQISQAAKKFPSPAAPPTSLPWPKSLDEETPKLGALEPKPLSNLAQVYGRSEELAPYICARCGQSNERWHEWSSTGGLAHFSRFFFGFWGIQALISFLLPLIAYVPGVDFTPVASERIGIPLAILLIFVNVSLLYGLRDSLWRYDLLARVGRGFRPPLALLGITAFVLALIFGLAIVFMLEARAATPNAGPTEGVARVITTILLAMTFVNVALSAMFMSAHDYSNWLNREMPQPIFAQERRLLGVIEDSLREKIQRATSKNKVVETTITDIERTADAGVILLISAETDADQVSEKEAFKQLQSWRIMANRWGRIQKLQTEGTPRYILIEEKPAEADKDEETENGKVEPAKEGELIIAGESFNSRSETTISIASNRRHWMG